MLIEAAAAQFHDDDESSGDDQDDGDQLSLNSLTKPADWPEGKNWGTLSTDASCTPADITYRTDLKLLNEARQSTERVIDDLCKQVNGYGVYRPRYDCGKACAHFLNVAKQKRPRRRRLTAAVRQQLDFLQRNLEAIVAVIADRAILSALKKHWWHKLLACSKLHRQQTILLHSKTGSIPDRLVSISVSNGLAFLNRLSWDAYNEGEDLIAQAKKYKQVNGCYPERVCADRIYINAKNRHFCARAGIRLSGKRLGRPPKAPEINAAHKQQLSADQGRRNEVEGVFGSGKRKYSVPGEVDGRSRGQTAAQ